MTEIEPKSGIVYEKHRDLKAAFLKLDPHCYWCRREVRDYGPRVPQTKSHKDEATIDHLVSRFFRKKGEIVEKVLACYQCNQMRSREENKIHGEAHKAKLAIEKLTEVEEECRSEQFTP